MKHEIKYLKKNKSTLRNQKFMSFNTFLWFVVLELVFVECSASSALSKNHTINSLSFYNGRSNSLSSSYKRVCIYPNWSALRDSERAKLLPEMIDPFICTHIHFAFANIDVRTLQLIPSQNEDSNYGVHGAVSKVFISKQLTNKTIQCFLSQY
jgi:GH18 family chitinase